jgi:hypothetical protein
MPPMAEEVTLRKEIHGVFASRSGVRWTSGWAATAYRHRRQRAERRGRSVLMTSAMCLLAQDRVMTDRGGSRKEASCIPPASGGSVPVVPERDCKCSTHAADAAIHAPRREGGWKRRVVAERPSRSFTTFRGMPRSWKDPVRNSAGVRHRWHGLEDTSNSRRSPRARP